MVASASRAMGIMQDDVFSAVILAVLVSIVVSPWALSLSLLYAKRARKKTELRTCKSMGKLTGMRHCYLQVSLCVRACVCAYVRVCVRVCVHARLIDRCFDSLTHFMSLASGGHSLQEPLGIDGRPLGPFAKLETSPHRLFHRHTPRRRGFKSRQVRHAHLSQRRGKDLPSRGRGQRRGRRLRRIRA